MSATVTPTQVAVADTKVAEADGVKGVVQETIDNPDFRQVLLEQLAPLLRQTGHSPIAGFVTFMITWAATRFGLEVPADIATALGAVVAVAGAYGYQQWSIWRGKKAAAAQAALPSTTSTTTAKAVGS